MTLPRLQFILRRDFHFGFYNLTNRGPLGNIYHWSLWVGPLEIRKWRK